MKITKRILSVVLALVLGLGLFLPVMAFSPAPNPNAPIITQQPGGTLTALYWRADDDLILEVQAAPPTGMQGTLSFEWFDVVWTSDSEAEPIATGARAVIPTTTMLTDFNEYVDSGLSGIMAYWFFCVVVTNTYIDDDGEEQTAFVRSDIIEVRLFANIPAAWRAFWTMWPPFPTIVVAPVLLPLSVAYTLLYPFLAFFARVSEATLDR